MTRLALSALASFALSLPLAAQEQTGMVYATCNIEGTPSPLQLQYTRYRDAVVWTDRHGTNASTTDMGQWGTTYWEGGINTPYGNYRLTGENGFIEAWLIGGVYSDMITLQMAQTGPGTFTLQDFYNSGPLIPCQITSQ